MIKTLSTIEAGDIILMPGRNEAVVIDYVKRYKGKVHIGLKVHKRTGLPKNQTYDINDNITWQTAGNVTML